MTRTLINSAQGKQWDISGVSKKQLRLSKLQGYKCNHRKIKLLNQREINIKLLKIRKTFLLEVTSLIYRLTKFQGTHPGIRSLRHLKYRRGIRSDSI